MQWYSTDESLHGAYTVTFEATGIDSITSFASYKLVVERRCIDAEILITVFAIPNLIQYTLEDPKHEQIVDEANVLSDHDGGVCDKDLVFEVTNEDGTALGEDTF